MENKETKKEKSFLKRHIGTFLKAMAIGATLRIPGMSGGTTAIILKIYDKLLNAVNTFFKNIKENALFLGVFVVGAGLAFFAFNSLLYRVSVAFPVFSTYFFCGIIVFGIPALLKEAGITYPKQEKPAKTKKLIKQIKQNLTLVLKDLMPFAFGVAVVVAINLLQSHGLLDGSGLSGLGKFVFNTVAGFFAGVALVLPGLSFTYFLTVIGLMDTFSRSLSFGSGDIIFLITFAVGAVIGLVATAKVLDRFIARHKRGTYAAVIGFLAGSVIMLLADPKYIPKPNQIYLCIIFFALGAALISFAGRLASAIFKRNQSKNTEPPKIDL